MRFIVLHIKKKCVLLFVQDIQLTASRDEHYFIFEDLIYQVGLQS